MPGHAVAADPVVGFVGRFDVVTVQFPGVELIVQSTGNTITTFVSVPDVVVSSHAVPETAAPVAWRLNLTNAVSTAEPIVSSIIARVWAKASSK